LSPRRPASTILFTNSGTEKSCFSLSSSMFAETFRATFRNVSSPTMSDVRKAALFGLPIGGPVMASTSSMV